jgi:hypothetical protein
MLRTDSELLKYILQYQYKNKTTNEPTTNGLVGYFCEFTVGVYSPLHKRQTQTGRNKT